MTYCGIVPSAGSRETYPLVQARCNVSVVDVNVHATLAQTYVSASAEPQDVAYVFPLPSDAAVCAFAAVIDNAHTIRGVVKEQAEAQREYDRAVQAGKTAALLGQHTSQVFEASLGNLKPGQTVVINIEFVSIIAHAGTLDSLRLRLPTTIAPFYGTPPATLDAHNAAIQVGSPSFELSASFQMSGNITSITSVTHPIALNLGSLSPDSAGPVFNPGTAHVSLTSDGALTSEIVLELKCDGLDKPRCTVERFSLPSDAGEVTDALSLTLVPRFQPVPVPSQEYIFLVDRSGSMSGGRMSAVRSALQIMLRSLPTKGTTFNVFSFGDNCTSLWPASAPYAKDSVDEAARHVEGMSANYGGTEIADALRKVVQSRKQNLKRPTALFVVTDGEAWDVRAVFKVVADGVADSDKALRVFVLGVGNMVSTEMCDGIARAGRGVVTYVREQEKPDAKLVGLLKAARSAVVQDITVDWGVPLEPDQDFEMVDANDAGPLSPNLPVVAPTEPVSLFSETIPPASNPALGPEDVKVVLPPPPALQQAPTHLDDLPPLYPGFRCSIFALIRLPPDAPLPTKVTVKGRMQGVPVSLDVPVVPAPPVTLNSDRVPFIHVLAARALIQSLEDDSLKITAPLNPVMKAKIVRLGTRYGIASSHTSFVAIDESGDAIPRPGRGSAATESEGRSLELEEDCDEESDCGMGYGLFDGDDQPAQAELLSLVNAMQAPVPDSEEQAPVPATSASVTLASVARAQQFDGGFTTLDVLKLATRPPPPPGFIGEAEVWNTVLALAFLQTHFKALDEREAWSFMGDKAREFVLDTVVDVMGIDQAKAESLLDEWVAYAVKQLSSAP
ncbi:hypothetical protein AURDEDRAFT_113100 [Auricularia subglabra TFB-10046 SS5]|nr:hypothetical protein AURDEDRAFT_113100 [Auricularia subglabra TFB-10046 SS5]